MHCRKWTCSKASSLFMNTASTTVSSTATSIQQEIWTQSVKPFIAYVEHTYTQYVVPAPSPAVGRQKATIVSEARRMLALRFNGHFPGEPGLAACSLKQRMMEVVSGDNWTRPTGAISRAKLQSYHHHQQTIQFFTGRMPFLSPNQQCQSTEGTPDECKRANLFSVHKGLYQPSSREPKLTSSWVW